MSSLIFNRGINHLEDQTPGDHQQLDRPDDPQLSMAHQASLSPSLASASADILRA
ncbi:hypothetical protein [Glutamicibacter protophormiae]|uniref:hypothetical protein n=1 Tax=Glutamicibacter protophormiae TaxID=37930 RepID=UPI003BAE92EA